MILTCKKAKDPKDPNIFDCELDFIPGCQYEVSGPHKYGQTTYYRVINLKDPSDQHYNYLYHPSSLAKYFYTVAEERDLKLQQLGL